MPTKRKLTKEEVDKIRSLYHEHEVSLADLGRRFGVADTTISDVVNYRRAYKEK